MRTRRQGAGILFSLALVTAMALSSYILYGERWRAYGEGPRNAYTRDKEEFKAAALPAVQAMLADLIAATKAPPHEPAIEDAGRKWKLLVPVEGEEPMEVVYSSNASSPGGIRREVRTKKGTQIRIFRMNLRSAEFRRTGPTLWNVLLFREVVTSYGDMGLDVVVYTFGRTER